jgi:hypothetical protein
MNERIKELAEQAGISLSQKDYSYYWVESAEDIEKFAELIIQECIDCVRGAGLTDEVAVKNNLGFNDGLSAAVVNVQKHFGVEE